MPRSVREWRNFAICQLETFKCEELKRLDAKAGRCVQFLGAINIFGKVKHKEVFS